MQSKHFNGKKIQVLSTTFTIAAAGMGVSQPVWAHSGRAKVEICHVEVESATSFVVRLSPWIAPWVLFFFPQDYLVTPEICGDAFDQDCSGIPDDGNCIPVCGDGFLQFNEECDDGNTEAGDGCGPDCRFEPVCGNGVLEAGEHCDDGNRESCDGCGADCLSSDDCCGDGIVQGEELCDDGNDVDGDGCDSTCEPTPVESVFAVNGEACERCVRKECSNVEGENLFDLAESSEAIRAGLSCLLVSGCTTTDAGREGLRDCYCGWSFTPETCLDMEQNDVGPYEWPDGVCRIAMDVAAGLYREQFVEMGDKIDEPSTDIHKLVKISAACVQDRCVEDCRPKHPEGTFVCGGSRCNIETEYCHIGLPGFPGALTYRYCAKKPEACRGAEIKDSESCISCLADPFEDPSLSDCEFSPEGGVIYTFANY